jgi:hypothetical protein
MIRMELDAPPSSLDSTTSLKMKITKGKGVGVRSLACSTSGVEGCARALGWGLGRLTIESITRTDLHKLNNKLDSVQLEHLRCTNEPRANTNSQDSPRPKLGGSHHLSPYKILCAWPWDHHSNVILSQDSQMWVPKFPKLGLPRLWRLITLCVDLQSRWHLNQSCSLSQELSNDMWHSTWTQGSQGDTWFLVVRSQIANLTLDPSFGHNLCFNYPNWSCKPILDIYISRYFQWYMELLN